MKVRRLWVLCVVASLATWVAPVASQTVSEKGQVTVSTHEVAMKAGNLYTIKIVGKAFQPHVMMKPGTLGFSTQDFTKPNQFLTYYYYFPNKNETNTIYVAPDLYTLKGKGPFDYTFELTAARLAAKPVLEVKAELTATDPPFKADFANRSHHKAHNIKLEAGKFYVIDMTSPEVPGQLDSFLYLLDSNGKLDRSDDDSGGYPNARIVFQSPQGGEYRIITTGLGDALGQFTLTVRTTEKQ